MLSWVGNGAGKSTFIKIIAGLIPRDGGTLKVDGKSFEPSVAQGLDAGAIAVVHQDLALLPHLSVAENIALPRRRRGASVYSEAASVRIAIEALSLIDPRFARESVGRQAQDLSLHEQQLVEIARALSSGARLLLLDEPTANLSAAETARAVRGHPATGRRYRPGGGVRVAPDAGNPRNRRRVYDYPRRPHGREPRKTGCAVGPGTLSECMGQGAATGAGTVTHAAAHANPVAGGQRRPQPRRDAAPRIRCHGAGNTARHNRRPGGAHRPARQR